jgi:hypothetical protein
LEKSLQLFFQIFAGHLTFSELVNLLMKNYENSSSKSYRYSNAPREKTVKAAGLKIFNCVKIKVSANIWRKKNGGSIEGQVSKLYQFPKADFSATAR